MLWLYLRVPTLPSPFSKHCCHCWPLLLWPWPLRSLLPFLLWLGRCGPLLWPHCCSAVAAQSFLRVPRLPPAPLKTSDPSLQLPSTASCVFWCCGSIFGFRDCHLLFQNIVATAGPCSCPLWPWPLRSLLPLLLWPWPLRSPAMAALLPCCGRPIFSSGSETAACPPQNLRPFAAASFHC